MNKELLIVGKRLPQVDAIDKVTGRAKFTADMDLPGMLFAKMFRSPYPHAKVLEVDTRNAEKLSGVKAILTIKDVPSIPYNLGCYHPPPEHVKDKRPYSRDKVIFDEKVRFVGDWVAAVAAESEIIAEEALGLIEVKYEQLPAVFDGKEAMKPEAPNIHSVKHNIAAMPRIEIGNIEKGFKESEFVFKDTYKLSPVQHCTIEPHVCVCDYDRAGKLTVWSSTQIPFLLQRTLAQALDMQVGKIRVIKLHIGGGFGGKSDMCQEPVCALLSMKTHLPVKMDYTREEEFVARRRASCIIELKTGVKNDGSLIARQAKAIVNIGAYDSHGSAFTAFMGHMFSSLYKARNIQYNGFAVYTNTPVAVAMRGFGTPEISYAIESQMDAIAEELGIDPIEFRLKNAVQSGDIDQVTGYNIASCGLRECVEKAAKKIGWKESKQKNVVKTNDVKKRGIGMACMTHTSGSPSSLEISCAILKINVDGTVDLMTGCSDLGQGSNTVLSQIVAEEIGVHLEDIFVTEADTRITPFDRGTQASRVTYIGGNAVKAAATDAKYQLLERGSKILNVDVKNLEIVDRQIRVIGDHEGGVTIADIVDESGPIIGEACFKPLSNAPPFGAQFAEVEVDTETGQIKLLRIVAAHDVGRAINPMLCEGQVEGALQMGIGYTLVEELVIDEENGKIQNPHLLDYKILTSCDMPKIDILLVESIEPTGPFGAKGIGEAGMIPTAPAIANAVYNAIGVRIKELPITPEKILEAIKVKSHLEQQCNERC